MNGKKRKSLLSYSRVATVYRRVMDELGVKISLSKFFLSKSGAMEFAKGFFVGTRDPEFFEMKSELVLPFLLCPEAFL